MAFGSTDEPLAQRMLVWYRILSRPAPREGQPTHRNRFYCLLNVHRPHDSPFHAGGETQVKPQIEQLISRGLRRTSSEP